jgi:hypothetical protein
MATTKRNGKQNVTISLDRKTIQKAKMFAAEQTEKEVAAAKSESEQTANTMVRQTLDGRAAFFV